MDTFKKIMLWVAIMVVFIIIGEIAAHQLLNTNYKNIEYKSEENAVLDMHINEAKATNVNGYAKLTITNISDIIFKKTYVVLEGYSKYNTQLVKEYIELDSFIPNQTRKAQINFKADGVEKVVVYQTDNIEKANNNIDLFEGFKYDKETLFLGALTLLCLY